MLDAIVAEYAKGRLLSVATKWIAPVFKTNTARNASL
jgi:hypothetical protein